MYKITCKCGEVHEINPASILGKQSVEKLSKKQMKERMEKAREAKKLKNICDKTS